MNTINFLRPALIAALILLLPALAMVFSWQVPDPGSAVSDGVNWTLSDFVIMGIMLFVAGLSIEFFVTRQNSAHKAIGIVVIVILFLWLWVELAVGLFTNWGS